MLHTIRTIFRILLYGFILLVGVIFAVSNKENIDLVFKPLPYALSLPTFLFAFIFFAAGLFLGWSIARFAAFRRALQYKETGKRIAALENEISAMRAEQVHKAVALPAR